AWFSVWLKLSQLGDTIVELSAEIVETELEIPGIEDIKEDILGTIQEMRPPNFLDHVGGAISNMLMFKMQKEAAGMGMLGNDNNPPSHAQEAWQGAE
ncbi:unnamed protein product, partial [marine sediment metagenome]